MGNAILVHQMTEGSSIDIDSVHMFGTTMTDLSSPTGTSFVETLTDWSYGYAWAYRYTPGIYYIEPDIEYNHYRKPSEWYYENLYFTVQKTGSISLYAPSGGVWRLAFIVFA